MSSVSWRPIDPGDPLDVAELKKQRVACGWDEDKVEYYLDQVRQENIIYWFFTLRSRQRHENTASGLQEVQQLTTSTDTVVIGSGGLDLSGAQNGQDMASHERKECCLMGLYLWPSYRGAGRFRQMAQALLSYGFETLKLHSATVMTLKANPVTNGLFKKLGFIVYFEEPRPDWQAENAYGWRHRVTKQEWRAASLRLI